MKILENINFTDLNNIPQLIKDFLRGDLADFTSDMFSLENFQTKIERKENSFSAEKRSILADCLKKQLANVHLREKQTENLQLLNKKNTFTITTGHQLNLFSGPAFFIYKILQTIKTASFLSQKFPEAQFVPIFWMATEDHDFEEINHFKTEHNFYEIRGESGGVVGKIVPENLHFITEFSEEFQDSVFGTELNLIIKEAYKLGNNLTEATRTLVQRLFSEFGLLMIDGDDASLKKQIIPIFEEELQHQTLKKYSSDKVDFLINTYGKAQVNPRDINLFYLTDTRDRIEFANGNYHIVDKNISFTKDEMMQELQMFPEKFSPNALMRPVFQEFILPNLAYIGGNAEIMYWLELKDFFANLEIPFPILIPRNSFLFLKEKTVEKVAKLKLEIVDLFKNFENISKNLLLNNHEILEHLDFLEIKLKTQFSEMKTSAESTDITFGQLVVAEETRQLKSFDRMKKRLLRAEKIKQSELLDRARNLFTEIHPSGIWQERVYNFSVFYAEEGESWLQFCLKEMPIENPELVIAVI
ncbi:bacillithiol biosynthesis cysteine-adding enzyme BshC [Frigoriflavimonas asaccharolytica]|uniref:Putative cysteine ligase BshC n=1 Tax=Frigoriflavimonas asaccharolytica TaxID=2735899 RepID=A0A8J8GA11_9FLAO|nr:bacillithiol biosynthesis cysteine-adding enzyme BshC [Frigoriflavimonas asaccharolytica]NRS92697.1 bacillithiol biosynthesis cysteine-adding enzyme BshC [Frigoriflavimonas asaccharolytica]